MICFSCKSRKSPRWHRTYVADKKGIFEICNACYIRMKKYQMLCQCCHFAATTKLIGNGFCPRCGNLFVNLFDRFPPKLDNECSRLIDILYLEYISRNKGRSMHPVFIHSLDLSQLSS